MNYTRQFVTTASAIAMLPGRHQSRTRRRAHPAGPAEPQQGLVPTDEYARISHDSFRTDLNGDVW